MKGRGFSKGDYVVEKDKRSFVYEVLLAEKQRCFVQGVNYRINKWFDDSCLELASSADMDREKGLETEYMKKARKLEINKRAKHLAGKILHIDGDKKYLGKCIDLYKEVGLYSYGACINEELMPKEVMKHYYEVLPDVIVITGHDLYNNEGYKQIDNYTNSKYYIETIKEIRKVDKTAVIIAGACQSNFEALIAHGADFASSPRRINIHTFDPAVIAIKAATTSVTKIIDLVEMYKYIENGRAAFGGLETFGKMRLIL